MQLLTGAGAFTSPSNGELNDFAQHLVVADLSIGTYSIPALGIDDQTPHTEDEIYIVTQGRGRLVTPDDDVAVGPGDVVYVPAGEEHRFADVTDDLALVVVFAPAYRSRA
jgi:mannose-6-phosphate isomerase-like protein (cupin superfamily)